MNGWMRRLIVLIWVLWAGALAAQGWQERELREVSFAVPGDWAQTYSARDTEYDFDSPDGRFTLWARWWFPDEPLLGFDDIVHHEERSIAGQPALYIHTESGAERMLQIAFTRTDADGEMFLLQLIGRNVDLASHEAMLAQLLDHLSYAGVPAKSAAVVPPATGGMGLHQDAAGNFAIPLPAGWQAYGADSPMLRQVALLPPERDRLVMVVSVQEDSPAAAQARLEVFVDLFMREMIRPRDIVDESRPVISGQEAYGVAYAAKIYNINGISMPYDRGHVWLYQMGSGAQRLAVITIEPRAGADPQIAAMVAGLQFGSGGGGVPITPVPVPQPAGAEWLAQMNARFGGDCRLLDLAAWQHPTRPVIEQAQGVIRFVMLCSGDTYPVFGVEFPFDPRAATNDYFYPLYGKVFQANGRWEYSFLEPRDGLLMSLKKSGENSLSLALEELAQPGAGDAPAAEPERDRSILFDGHSLRGWQELVYYGGDFATHARLTGGALAVDIPEKLGWALAGLGSDQAVMRVPDAGGDTAQELRLNVDFDATRTLFIAFADAEQMKGEPWNAYDLRLMATRDDLGKGRYRLDRAKTSAISAKGPWPQGVQDLRLSLRPDGVLILRSEAGIELLRADIPAEMRGKDWHLRVYSRPAGKNAPAGMVLRQVRLDPAAMQADPDPDRLAWASDEGQVMFDGSGLSGIWAPYEDYEGHFHKYGVIDGALRIDRAAETDKAVLGLYSPEAVLWLDRFTAEAEARVELDLDGAGATGLDLTLTQRVGLDFNVNHSWWASWTPAEGGITFRAQARGTKEVVEVTGLSQVPDRAVVVITPAGIRVEAEGLPATVLPFVGVMEGAGLRLYAIARRLPGSHETRLTLNRIATQVVPGPVAPAPVPAAGVDPLPMVEVLRGVPDATWERQAPGGLVYADLAQESAAGIRLTREDKPPNGNRVALVSQSAVIKTDRRIYKAVQRVSFELDPTEANLGGRIVFANGLNPLKQAQHEIGLRLLPGGRLRLSLHTGHFSYDHWQRLLPAGWHQTQWDGRVHVDLGDGWIRVTLGARDGADVSVAARTDRSRRDAAYHLALMPGTMAQYEPGSITLRGIRAGWLTPDGMSAEERWHLVEDADFDPEAYADILARGLLEE